MLSFLVDGGQMGAAVRAHDWSQTSLGPPASWPTALKTLIGVVLGSNQPMFVAWGAQQTLFYNDAYSEILANKHPNALGRSFLEVWSEIREDLIPIVDAAYRGEPVHMDDITLMMTRRGYVEETHFAFSYTPIRAEGGVVNGFFCACTEITAQVLAERRRIADTERQRRMFEQAPGFIAILHGPEHKFEFANATYSRLFGERDVVGKTVREAFPDLKDQGFYELLDSVFETGERFVANQVPITLQQANGLSETRYLDFIYEPITDDIGNSVGIFVEGHDATEARRALAELRNSEERYRTLFNSIESGFCVVEVREESPEGQSDYRVVEANPAFYRQTGFPEEILGRWLREVAPTLEEHWYQTYERVARTGVPERFEEGAASLERWFDVYAFRVGEPVDRRVAILFNDISGRREAEEALKQLNETLERRVARAIAERDRTWNNARDLLLVVGSDGVFQAVNPAWTVNLGWRPDELVGRDYLELIHPDDHPSSKNALASATEDELPVYENRYRHKDGSFRWISWVAAPEGELIYASGRDVTAEKEQAEALRRAEDQLRQAQKMEAVGQLTGGIAHDFNNLLAGISGSLEVIERRLSQGRTEGIDRFLSGAQTSTQRAAALTQRLLAFSRRQTLDPRPTDVNRLVVGMEDLIHRTVGPAIKVEVVGAAGLWPTLIDPAQLENALLNLAINARDAMPEGGKITIETANKWLDERASNERDLPPGQYLSVCVTDTGTGIPKDIAERIFDPFFTTKPIGQGTGLGLSMIHGFVRQSGGQVRVYSELGQGTTMCLYLPRYSGEVGGEDCDIENTIADVGDGQIVLVIDDEPMVRMLIVEVLQEAGYIALEAEDGPSGLKILDSDVSIDLLITDVGLPGGMNGRQVADAARVNRPDLKVLFVTGYAENAAVANGHLDPTMAVITKPFVMAELASKITDMIER